MFFADFFQNLFHPVKILFSFIFSVPAFFEEKSRCNFSVFFLIFSKNLRNLKITKMFWLIFSILLLIAIVVAGLWLFVFSNPSGRIGQQCMTNSDCDSFEFCSGNTTCQAVKGKSVGGKCDPEKLSKDCRIGTVCVDNVCK